jgi:hypothetical protein
MKEKSEKIKDSIQKSGSGKPADEGVVKTIIKKAILIEDSWEGCTEQKNFHRLRLLFRH